MALERFRPAWREGAGPIPRYVIRPTARFLAIETAGGSILVAAALTALVWANLATESYTEVWNTQIVIDLDVLRIAKPLVAWVNDALMVIFFFVVGMEIKREVARGELADRRQALIPAAAALGGMVVPAVFFVAVVADQPGGSGWGIPVATDIAFALGVLALLGRRVPVRLKVFLLALAIVDDIGGILIIAAFYTDDIAWGWLGAAAGLLVLIVAMNRGGVRAIPAYLVVGAAFWLATFESGVHATIAGVLLGLLTPVGALYDEKRIAPTVRARLEAFDHASAEPDPLVAEHRRSAVIHEIEEFMREARSPLERLEHVVTPWSAFLVVPIFALANAGIELSGETLEAAVESRAAWGIAAGLVLGKPIGILAAVWLATRITGAPLPGSWRQLVGVATLAGIGFTVAIFIATLAYDDPSLVREAKTAILFASGIAAVGGYFVLRALARAPSPASEG